jgi:hypothetical protein
MNLEHATLIFLIALFVLAELYHMARGERGLIIDVHEPALAHFLPAMQVTVELTEGREVVATLSGCTACLGRLQIGDEVLVRSSKDGYVVDLPWVRKHTCADGCDARSTNGRRAITS